jgi:hypothetical protein
MGYETAVQISAAGVANSVGATGLAAAGEGLRYRQAVCVDEFETLLPKPTP